MNETNRRAYFGLALALACADSHYAGDRPKRSRVSGEDASQRAICLNDHKKLSTRKQRMKEAMRRAAMGEK